MTNARACTLMQLTHKCVWRKARKGEGEVSIGVQHVQGRAQTFARPDLSACACTDARAW